LAEELRESAAVQVWDVTGEPQWAALIHRPIVAVKVYWLTIFRDDPTSFAPVCIAISFDAESAGQFVKVYLCAGQYVADSDTLALGGDEVLVIFREEMVQRYCSSLVCE
jgi:hypothetical protein